MSWKTLNILEIWAVTMIVIIVCDCWIKEETLRKMGPILQLWEYEEQCSANRDLKSDKIELGWSQWEWREANIQEIFLK